MRKALGLVFLGCALVVGLACSDGATTPTEPAVTATTTSTSSVQSIAGASADKIYLCHGNRSEPYGVVVEVGDEYYKRHIKHLAKEWDCICGGYAPSGDVCSYYSGGDDYCDSSCW